MTTPPNKRTPEQKALVSDAIIKTNKLTEKEEMIYSLEHAQFVLSEIYCRLNKIPGHYETPGNALRTDGAISAIQQVIKYLKR